MIEGDFDRWTLANMDAALDEVCRSVPRGEEHAIRKRIARQIIKCAKSGRTTLERTDRRRPTRADRALTISSDRRIAKTVARSA